ncbi:MAG: glycosyltransferase family 39 protein [Candidatus Paceibacterota bacterium]|jgi:4-amino-4-deoxy-L-arabinose transferase-like glycosyltransferase
MSKMKTFLKSPTFYLLLIIIIATFLRFYNFTNVPPGLYPDEAMNGNNALESLSTGHFKVFYPENNGREGLFINIQAFFIWLFKVTEPWVLHIPSALFGIFTVLGIYFLAKELFKSTSVGLLSSFFAATSFWLINFSRIGFRAIMAPFFLVWGLYFLIKAFRNSRFLILNSVLAGIFYGLGFHSYIAYRVTPLLILFVLIYFLIRSIKENWQKKFWLITLLFMVVTIAVFLPLGMYFLKNPQDFLGRTSQISVFSSPQPLKTLLLNTAKTFGMFNVAGDFNWRHNYSGRPELFWPVGILFLIGVFLAIKNLIQNSKIKNQNDNSKIFNFPFCILILWLLITSLPVVVSNEGLPHALRAILMAPAFIILAGLGGVWLYGFIKSKIITHNLRTLNIFIGLFLIILVCEAYLTYFVLWAKNPNVAGAFNQDSTRIGHELKSTCGENCAALPKYVIVEAGGTDVRGIPMPAQTVMFITDTFTPEKQNAKNLHYVLPSQISQIPQNSLIYSIK